MSEPSSVPVRSLLPADSPRLDGIDQNHARTLVELLPDLPPILVHRNSMRVVDGMHRLRAAQLCGKETIKVQFFDGDADDAFVNAVRMNISHGLPLTLADREAAAARILGAYPYRSDRWVARSTGLAARTVARIRSRLTPDPGTQATGRLGRDGRVRPLSSVNARRLAAEVMARRPDASIRTVALEAGISPATALDVRERLRRGEDPVPSGQRFVRQKRDQLSRKDWDVAGGGAVQADVGRPVRHRQDAPFDPAKDGTTLLRSLSKDPSLRFSESGRALLRTLFAQVSGPSSCGDLINKVPPHVAFAVVELARRCADDWHEFAERLEQRLGPSA